MSRERDITVDPKTGRVRVQTLNKEKSMTDQSFKDQVDVNQIVAKYQKTGQWLHMTGKTGVYADVSQINDYQESLEKVIRANEAFMALPSSIRTRFQNDPSQLLEFLQDTKNRDEAIDLGLIEKPTDRVDTKGLQNDARLTRDEIDAPPVSSQQASLDDKSLLNRFQDFLAKNPNPPKGST